MNLPHCPAGERIIEKQGDNIVLRHGEPTMLYWHLSSCAACEYLQEQYEFEIKQQAATQEWLATLK